VVASEALPATDWSLSVRGHGPKSVAVTREMTAVTLGDWASLADLANFSGEAVYRRSFIAQPGWTAKGGRVILDLGKVNDMAIVTLNGRALPPAIAAPYRVDLTPALKAGKNNLAIAVYNSPNNAMIDPKAAGFKLLKPVPAGLVGPVRVEVER
jgi:hypothetical protein